MTRSSKAKAKKARPENPDGLSSLKGISAGHEMRSPHHGDFPRHHHDCFRHLRRHDSRRHFHHRNHGSARNRNATGLDSCGWALSKFAARSTTAKAVDCTCARAAHCTIVAAAETGRDWFAPEARKSARRLNSWGGCCWCSVWLRASQSCSRRSPNVRPTTDDHCGARARTGRELSKGDWIPQILPARGHGRSHCLALPTCVG